MYSSCFISQSYQDTPLNSVWCSDAIWQHISWLTHWGRDKMAAVSQTTLSNAFSWMKMLEFDYDFTEVCSLGSNWQYPSIGSDNGLAPVRRQAIIWTNWLVYWRIYASLGLNELRFAQEMNRCWIILYGVMWPSPKTNLRGRADPRFQFRKCVKKL